MAGREHTLRERLRARLEQGPFRIGQVRVTPEGAGAVLGHWEDQKPAGEVFTDPHDAIAIARYDDDGAYRPLKTAPNLRHDWSLQLANADDVLLALDFLYPAAWATSLAWSDDELVPVDLPETLARQSGMYAVVKKLERSQAEEVVREVCRGHPGCLRRMLWKIEPGDAATASPDTSEDKEEIPLLCAEACNLFVAAGRKAVKGKTAGG